MIAANARTSVDMINRFYGSHIKSAANQGTVFVDTEKAIRDKRYDKVNELAKEIGVVFDAYAEDPEGDALRRKKRQEARNRLLEMKRASNPKEVKKALASLTEDNVKQKKGL